MTIKYPHVKVKLTGQNGNVFNLIGLTDAALKKGLVSAEERDEFRDAAFNAGSYNEVLQIIMKTVNVE